MAADLRARLVTSMEALEALYAKPGGAALVKEIDHVNAHYRAFIEASPLAVLATCGPEGLDCSPRGDAPGFVRVHNAKTLLVPDRRGNNRIDSFRNILRDPRAAMLFLIPGVGETLRVNGRAAISADPELAAGFAVEGKAPRCVLVIFVESVYFQCSRAVTRAGLWDPARQVERSGLPSVGAILAALSQGRAGGEDYDRDLPEHVSKTLY